MEFNSLLLAGPPKTKLCDLQHHSAAPWTLTGLGHGCIPGEPEICELQRAAHYCDKLSFMWQQSNSRCWRWASQQLCLHSRLHALHNLSHSVCNYLLETLICFSILSTLSACKQILTTNSSTVHELQRFRNFKCLWSTLAPPVTQVSYKDFLQTTDIPTSSLDTDFQAVSAAIKHVFQTYKELVQPAQNRELLSSPDF